MSLDNNKIDTTSSRGNWGTRVGFILAASGSAIGLGNIWKFPYMTGVHGGGAFVIIYLVCVLLVGLPIMISEFIIGKHTKKNPVGAFMKLLNPKTGWRFTGWLGIASGFLILSFYSVVAGWALAYIFKAIVGFSGTPEAISGQFTSLIESPWHSIMWHTIFIVLNVLIVMGGIKSGIERWSKILMPLLITILLGLVIYGLAFTHGGKQAISFLFNPDFSKITAVGVLSALGHAFFTLSIGMGAMLTYGSYMGKETSIIKDAVVISFLDTIIALMAGVAIFSMVFNYGLEPSEGPGLIFVTLPILFAETGPWVSVPFFILLSFAALTSGISLLEVVVSYFIDEKNWSRKKATIILGSLIYLIGLLSCISSLKVPFTEGTNYLDFFGALTTNFMLPIGGLLTAIFVGWVMLDSARSQEFGSREFLYKGFLFTLRYISPIILIIVILHGLEMLPFVDY